jgi:hypothetical protein
MYIYIYKHIHMYKYIQETSTPRTGLKSPRTPPISPYTGDRGDIYIYIYIYIYTYDDIDDV